MITVFFNMIHAYAENWAWFGGSGDYALSYVTSGLMGFMLLNVVAIICARFADLLHSILKKG